MVFFMIHVFFCVFFFDPSLLFSPAHNTTARENMKKAKEAFEKSEDDLKSLQSVGQMIGEVLKQLDEERCKEAPISTHVSF